MAAATVAGHIDAAMYLLGRGASVIRAGRTGMSALHIAAAYDRSALVTAFSSQPGVDINLLDEKDMTPLHHAALAMSFSTISKLLEHGAAYAKKFLIVIISYAFSWF
jgi:ankyrin repeat protein